MLHIFRTSMENKPALPRTGTPSFYFTQLPLVEMLCRKKASGLEPPSLERR
jgi:hypothetical protein